jgi:hypothetical protein
VEHTLNPCYEETLSKILKKVTSYSSRTGSKTLQTYDNLTTMFYLISMNFLTKKVDPLSSRRKNPKAYISGLSQRQLFKSLPSAEMVSFDTILPRTHFKLSAVGVTYGLELIEERK